MESVNIILKLVILLLNFGNCCERIEGYSPTKMPSFGRTILKTLVGKIWLEILEGKIKIRMWTITFHPWNVLNNNRAWTLDSHSEIYSEYCQIEPNLDNNYSFPIDLVPNRIICETKSTTKL